MSQDERLPPEPFIKAPLAAIALPVFLIGVYMWLGHAAPAFTAENWALSPETIRYGRYDTLVTHMLVHAGWGHLLINSAFALAFGAPVARLLGGGPVKALAFLTFFVLCGVIGGLGFIALHWGGVAGVVGASGGVSGLWGAASRLLGRQDRLAPLTSRPVLTQFAVFMVLNLATGLGAGLIGLGIAWEAHALGYIAGLLLIGPWARLFARRD